MTNDTTIQEIKNLMNSEISNQVITRILEFEELGKKNSDHWFSELCFCILTANSKADTAINIQNILGPKGFIELPQEKIAEIIRENKHRFHNNKSRFIKLARAHTDIKKKVQSFEDELQAREWIVNNIKGLGYKEASHFLRNVGYKNLSILDRHILRYMQENGLISNIPKTLTRKIYLEIESRFNSIAKNLNLSPAELDLYMWYLKTGKILK